LEVMKSGIGRWNNWKGKAMKKTAVLRMRVEAEEEKVSCREILWDYEFFRNANIRHMGKSHDSCNG